MSIALLLLLACFPGREDYEEVRAHLQDRDGDGYITVRYGGEDCDDEDAAVNPGAVELCDEVDNDCDSDTDKDGAEDVVTWYADGDGDGFGSDLTASVSCDAPSAVSVVDGGDCDDGDATVNPLAPELCGGADEDCDGVVDEAGAADAPSWFLDEDGDGYGSDASEVIACDSPGDGYVMDGGDCDEDENDVNPGVVEACNDGVDNDCDGRAGACEIAGAVDLAGAGIWSFVLDNDDGDQQVGDALVRAGTFAGEGAEGFFATSDVRDASPGSRGPGLVLVGLLDLLNAESAGFPDDLAVSVDSAIELITADVETFDLDGDGNLDVLLGASSGPDWDGGVMVVMGGARTEAPSLPSESDWTLQSDVPSDLVGASVAGLLEETAVVLVGQPGSESDSAGRVDLIPWVAGGSATVADRVARISGSEGGARLGTEILTQDLNGDGFAEAVLGMPWSQTSEDSYGEIRVFEGPFSSDLALEEADAVVWLEDGHLGELGSVVTAAPGLGGDGTPTLVFGAPGYQDVGAVFLIEGQLDAKTDLSASSKVIGLEVDSRFGASLAGGGDLDGDGVTDLAIGAPDSSPGGHQAGQVFLFYGPVSGTLSTDVSAAQIHYSPGSEEFGHAVTFTADLGVNGQEGLVISDPSAAGGLGAVFYLPGSGL